MVFSCFQPEAEGQKYSENPSTTNQTEIDFFVTRGNATQAIEVKWGRDTKAEPAWIFTRQFSIYMKCPIFSPSNYS